MADLNADEEDLYEVLGVSNSATDVELKRAYRREALRWHPDKSTHPPEVAAERFKLVSHAYTVLSDPAQRQAYDGDALADDYDAGRNEAWSEAWSTWRDFAEAEEREREASRRKEASFRAGSVVFFAWSAVLAALTWQQSRDVPLMFPSALGPLSTRELGDISLRTDFRDFSSLLVERRRASLGPVSQFISQLPGMSSAAKAHNTHLNVTFRPADVQPASRDASSAAAGQPLGGVLLSSPRKVGKSVRYLYTFVYAPPDLAIPWPPRGSVCIRLLRSGTVKRRTRTAWFDVLATAVDGRLRPFALEATDPEDCQPSVGALPLSAVVVGAAVLSGVTMRVRSSLLAAGG
jgi:curved DNA-binding protein CbpA